MRASGDYRSKRRKAHRARTCSGKVRYRDREEAMYALRSISGPRADRPRHPEGKRPMRAYECPACHGWHLTSRGER